MGVGADAQQVLALHALAGALRAGATPHAALREARAHVDPSSRAAWDSAVALADDGASLGVAVGRVVPAEMRDGVERMRDTELAVWLTALAEASSRRWSMARRVGAAVGYPVLVAACAVVGFIAWTAMLGSVFVPWGGPGWERLGRPEFGGMAALVLIGLGTVVAALVDALVSWRRGTIPRWARALPGGRAIGDTEDIGLYDTLALIEALPHTSTRSEQLRAAAACTGSSRWATNLERAPHRWNCDATVRILLTAWLDGDGVGAGWAEVAGARRAELASAVDQLQRWMTWTTLLCAGMTVVAAILPIWGSGLGSLTFNDRPRGVVAIALLASLLIPWLLWARGGVDRTRRSATLPDAFAALLSCGLSPQRTAAVIAAAWPSRFGRRRMRRMLAALDDGHPPARAAVRGWMSPRFVELVSLWSQSTDPTQVARGWYLTRRDRARAAIDPLYATVLGGLLLGIATPLIRSRTSSAAPPPLLADYYDPFPAELGIWPPSANDVESLVTVVTVLLALCGLLVARSLVAAWVPIRRGALDDRFAALVADTLDTGRSLVDAVAGAEATLWAPVGRWRVRAVGARLADGTPVSEAFDAGGFRVIARAMAGDERGAGDRIRRAAAAVRAQQRATALGLTALLTVAMMVTAAMGVALMGDHAVGGVLDLANAIAAWGFE